MNVLLYRANGTLQMWLSQGPGDGEIVLDHLEKPNSMAVMFARVKESESERDLKIEKCWL